MRCRGPSEDECPKMEALNEYTVVAYKLFKQTKIDSKDVTLNLNWNHVKENQRDIKSNLAKALQERFNEGLAADTYKVSVTNVQSAAQNSETEIKDQLNATKDATKRRRARPPRMDSRAQTLTSALTELQRGILPAHTPVAVGVPTLSLSTTQAVVPTKVSTMTPTQVLTEVPTEVSSMTPTEMLINMRTKVRTEVPIQMPTMDAPSVVHRLSDVSGVSLEDLPLGPPSCPIEIQNIVIARTKINIQTCNDEDELAPPGSLWYLPTNMDRGHAN